MAGNNKTILVIGVSDPVALVKAVNEKITETDAKTLVDTRETEIRTSMAEMDVQVRTAVTNYTNTRETVVRGDMADADTEVAEQAATDLHQTRTDLLGGAGADYDTLKKLQTKVEEITKALSGADTPDVIDTLNEALAFIVEHHGDITSLAGTYIAKSSIVDNLTTADAAAVLSARQGVELKKLITALQTAVSKRVLKVAGSGLITDALLQKLEAIAEGANNYIHPDSHSADMIVDSETKVMMELEERELLAGLAVGGITPDQLNEGLATKAALVPHSLTEQPVPGEFWTGTDSVSRQVYQRTFVGTFPTGITKVLLTGVRECFMIAGGYTPLTGGFFNNNFMSFNNAIGDSVNPKYIINIYVGGTNLNLQFAGDSSIIIGTSYSITAKYTKS